MWFTHVSLAMWPACIDWGCGVIFSFVFSSSSLHYCRAFLFSFFSLFHLSLRGLYHALFSSLSLLILVHPLYALIPGIFHQAFSPFFPLVPLSPVPSPWVIGLLLGGVSTLPNNIYHLRPGVCSLYPDLQFSISPSLCYVSIPEVLLSNIVRLSSSNFFWAPYLSPEVVGCCSSPVSDTSA